MARRPAPRAPWRAPGSYDVPPGELVPWARNPRVIAPEAVARLAASIASLGWGRPVLVRASDATIIAGHRSVQAALHLGLEAVPVRAVEVDDDTLAKLAVADNAHGDEGTWDGDALADLLSSMGDLDLDLLGLTEDGVSALLAPPDPAGGPLPPEPDEDEDEEGSPAPPGNRYTAKVVSPVYVPRGYNPTPGDLYDRAKTERLLADIRAAELSADVRAFLASAAERHTRFNFAKIAEAYAHAPKEVQALFEASGLVIVDFGRAIELGFVHLTDRLLTLTTQESPTATPTDVPGGPRAG